jgi:anti-sigma B factor antagonist
MSTEPSLTFQVAQTAGYAVVTPAGSIDFTSHELLEEQLDQALQMTRLAVIVDMNKVNFCDSSGLNTFARAHHQATARGLTIILTGLQERVRRVFSITRLDQAFYPQPDLETAIQWLENGSTSPGAS